MKTPKQISVNSLATFKEDANPAVAIPGPTMRQVTEGGTCVSPRRSVRLNLDSDPFYCIRAGRYANGLRGRMPSASCPRGWRGAVQRPQRCNMNIFTALPRRSVRRGHACAQ